MRRPRRRRYKGQASWWMLIAATLAALAAGGAFVLTNRPSAIDEATLCPEETGPTAGVVILLDLTDPLGRTQHERLTGILAKTVKEAETNTLFAVGAVEASPDERGAKFGLCKPLEGVKANELYQNPTFVKKRYEEKFKKPLDTMLDEMLAAKPADRSPIMESLQAVLVSAPGFLDADYPRYVLIVSDLLQHSAAFSFYGGGTWKSFKRSPDFRRLAKNVGGMDVVIYRVPRPGTKVNNAKVEDFWVHYFEDAGVKSLSSRSLGDL